MSFVEYEHLSDNFLHEVVKLSDNNFNIYYLIHAFYSVNKGGMDFYDAWVFKKSESWAIGLRVDGMYLIYGNDEDDSIISKLNERINNEEVDYLQGFHFTGTKAILDKLMKKANFDFEIYKERYFYTLVERKEVFKKNVENVTIRKSTINDLSIIAKMNSDYNSFEWKGKNNRTAEEFKPLLKENVRNGVFFIIEFNNEIVGFCSVMSFLSKINNMIGTIYIEENHRNKNLGTILLSHVINELLKNAEKIYLMTDMQSLSSNKLVENAGFEKNYEYSDLIFKKYK